MGNSFEKVFLKLIQKVFWGNQKCWEGPEPNRLFGGSRLSESRNVLTDGSIGSEWSRLQNHFEILTKGSRRTAAAWTCLKLSHGARYRSENSEMLVFIAYLASFSRECKNIWILQRF